MRSSRRTEVPHTRSAQLLTDHNIGTELTTAWKTLAQSKAALRHIENRLEATPGTATLLDSIPISPKKKRSSSSRSRDGQQGDESRGTSKRRGGNQQSPAKSSSRSPLRNATQDNNVRKNSNVEFREPLASYREATPPSHPFSQLEAYNLQSVPGSLYTSSLPSSDPVPSQLIYQRDTRDKQTDGDLDSTRSSALESAEVRYLNDQPVLDSLKTEHKAQLVMDSRESKSFARTPSSSRQGESTPSSSPGSVSQRLENLRRHQPDDKLEKLKERIRRQRQHLEETANKEKSKSCLEKPIITFVEGDNVGSSSMPAAKIRKVTAAPPAPIYRGFNSAETKVQIPDGTVWKEEEFHNYNRKVYRDISHQFPESSKFRHQHQRAERSKEKRPSKPVRKVQKVAPVSEQNFKAVISPASWREGQKLVKMVLGPAPKLPNEEHSSHPAGRQTRTASHHRSDSHSEQRRHSRPNSTDRSRSAFQEQTASHPTASYSPSSSAQDKMPRGVKTDVLSVDIQGILNDLQLDCKSAEMEERARKRSRGVSGSRRGRGGSGSRTRAPVSAWESTGVANVSSRVSRSASPTTRQPDCTDKTSQNVKKRHYDADTVRQYIAQQQEERKRRQAEEKRALKQEAAKRNQRLQELYKKQKEVVRTATLSSEAVVAPVQKRLQETYTRLLLEDARLSEATPEQHSASFIQMRPMYQPSGESDKENKRIGVSQSPSSSDKSLNEQPPLPLSRNDLEFTSVLQPDHLNPAFQPTSGAQVASNEHLLNQLLRLEAALASSNRKYTEQPAAGPHLQSPTRMSRIEALKAKATSLSNRIETEALRFAGQGINYGAATSMDVDTVLQPRTSSLDVDHWTGTVAHATENIDFSFKAQKAFTNAANTSYTGIALPGAGNLYDLNEKTHTSLTNPHTGSPGVNGLTLNTYTQEDRRSFGDLDIEERTEKLAQRIKTKKPENLVYPYQTELHDSSAGSISEGPLLSEGSFSEEYGSPPHYTSNHGCNSDYLEAEDYSSGKRSHIKRLFEFQREAAQCTALSPPFTQLDGSKAPWEELNKGSPLSVINIFTKNVQGHVKVSERASGNNSPLPHSSHSEKSQDEAAVYEDDFVSSHSSKTSSHLKRGPKSPSRSQRISPGSTPGSSPLSRHSTSKRATISDQSDATLVEEQRSSPLSENFSSDHKKRASDRSLSQAQAKSADSDTLGEPSAYSPQRSKLVSSSCSPDLSSPLTADSLSEHVRRSSHNPKTSSRAESWSTGELQYSPAVLQQRMAAELQYLESIEESIKQLGDVEKLMGVSMAQQESASLTQMLKAKQHRHEQELYELKIKTEREALETQLQLEENRQRVARAHLELQENLATSQKQTLEGLQESTSKMMSQQAEAARYTADAARHIKEMTDLARSQIVGHLIIPPVATDSAMLVQQEELNSSYTKQQDKADSGRFKSEVSDRRTWPGEPSASQNGLSRSDSPSFRRPNISGSPYGSIQISPSHAPSDHTERPNTQSAERKQKNERVEERMKREAASSSIEEDVITAANDSLCSESIVSAGDEKGDTTSVATEYSLKFDESMTEDEIEERSFRSLLPSEAHRRGTMEKKSHHQKEGGGVCLNEPLVPETGSCSSFKSHDAHIAFSGGQDSFSQFTMEMVRQYMRDEEVRLQHQSSLLHLRQKALKEKTRAEVAWLEHQKKKLRDKGEDDKMPPIRKKQRGLLLKLQQEQAEIRRLQEANRAARKERQLLLKQQEEIERMRNSTLRLKERLKCAEGDVPPETPVSEPSGSEVSSQRLPSEARTPSPSLSISGSETSSIMQKLKKMRSHMDEKHCSPVHYFFSVFTAHHWASLSVCLPNLHPKFQLFIYNQLVRFLTKREQQLMQRRHHAEELLQWKQQLDKEEAEVRRMEKEALAAWNQRRPCDKDHKTPESIGQEISETGPQASHHQSLEARSDSEKELVSEDNCSSITTESSVHTEAPASQHPLSPSSAPPASAAETPLVSVQSSHATYTQDFSTASQLPAVKSSSVEGSRSPTASPLDNSSKMQPRSTSRTHSEVFPQVLGAATAMPSENISDQSDIESRIKALREELRKRKIMAHQLKKEQMKRHKERLKAQEATLLKKLENYNNFIEKTKAELNKEPESTPETTSHINDSNYILEQSSAKPSSQRSEAIKSSTSDRTLIDASLDHNAIPQPNHSRTTSRDLPEDSPNVDMYSRPESDHLSEPLSRSFFKPEPEEEKALSDHRSDIEEELEVEVNSRSEDEQSHHLLRLDSQEKLTASERVLPFAKEEHEQSLSGSLDQEELRKRNNIPEAEETVTLNHITPGAPSSGVVNLEASPHSSRSPSPSDPPLSPHSGGFSLNKDPLIQDVEASVGADGYQEDFESANSSPRDEHLSKHESQASIPHTETKHSTKESSRATPPFDHQDDDEDEIPEEMNQHSGISEKSHHSEMLLELQQKEEDIKLDNKTEFSSHAPASPPIEDEMPGFHLGDRVLVGGVQPGTLRFKGPTSFANGFWAGVELDKSEGSNNGTYDGVVYFECEESHGIFAPPDKVSHLPDKFELYADTTEDEDSFFDDLSDKDGKKHKKVKDGSQKWEDPEMQNERTSDKETKSKDEMVLDENNQIPLKTKTHLNSQKEPEHQICNGTMKDIILDFTDESRTFLIPDEDRMEEKNEKTNAIIERNDVDVEKDLIPTDEIKTDKREQKNRDLVETFAEDLINKFIKDSFKQCAEIKRAKEEKIRNANQLNGCSFVENDDKKWISSAEQKDNLPFFLPAEKEELSSPEMCNRSESPVFGPSGQEKLAKRLAELELSRELLEDVGDDQDWFDEDFGLSSRRQQQRLKQKEELGGEFGRSTSSSEPHMGGMVSSLGGESQVKTPPRPELPLPLPPKLPEQPAMVVPHSATEVEKMIHSATLEIWQTFDLGREGSLILEHLPKPTPSQEYLGKESSSQDQEALSISSYKKAVYDLTWEILKEIFAEDPNTDQPQWVKPRQVKSSSIHRVKTSGDINKIQEFVTEEVLKLYGLTQDENQKTDWQKMLKFGRKKRDRVDHILVQELHEEEAQWVNYDEDELYVKIQLADSIFEALLKDTVNTFTLISDKRAKRGALS